MLDKWQCFQNLHFRVPSVFLLQLRNRRFLYFRNLDLYQRPNLWWYFRFHKNFWKLQIPQEFSRNIIIMLWYSCHLCLSNIQISKLWILVFPCRQNWRRCTIFQFHLWRLYRKDNFLVSHLFPNVLELCIFEYIGCQKSYYSYLDFAKVPVYANYPKYCFFQKLWWVFFGLRPDSKSYQY